MSNVTRPRGPLPPRVYWTRRLLMLGVALALVFGIAHLLGGGGGDRSATVAAQKVGAAAASPSSGPTPTPTSGATARRDQTSAKKVNRGTKVATAKPVKVKTPLAVPTGACADSDIRINPSVDSDAYAGSDVAITLNLTTVDSPACTWEVTPKSVVLKVTSGSDRLWSTQDCPQAIAREAVVVRSGHQTKVYVTWNGQRSDAECSRSTGWAEPGFYHAEAAALGSEPGDHQFELQPPVRPTITPTPKPHKKQSKTN